MLHDIKLDDILPTLITKYLQRAVEYTYFKFTAFFWSSGTHFDFLEASILIWMDILSNLEMTMIMTSDIRGQGPRPRDTVAHDLNSYYSTKI
jgi:hypothetical protein